jgi:cation diffusion facilitator family transporter
MGGKALLAWSQYAFGKKAGSAMLRANAKNMTADVLLSGGGLAGLFISIRLQFGAADAIMAILVGLWVIKSAVGILMEVNLELMDGAAGTGSYQAVFDAVRSVEGAGHPHRTRMRRIAGLWDIDLDIEVKPSMTVLEAHWIAHKVEKAIKERVEGVYDIMVHVEPAGNIENESYGLSEGVR